MIALGGFESSVEVAWNTLVPSFGSHKFRSAIAFVFYRCSKLAPPFLAGVGEEVSRAPHAT